MNLPGRKMVRLTALLGAGQLLAVSLSAQVAASQTVAAPADSTPARPPVSEPSLPPARLPPMPPIRPPISFFRELLAMNAAERKQALTNRPPEVQKQILGLVREYVLLDPDERELRLRVTELRWDLVMVMTAPATNRPVRLAAIPDPDRQLVEARLQAWDKLPPDVQKELLANEATLSYLSEIEGRTPEQRRQTLETISPARRALLEQGIDKWDSMSEDQRRKMLDRFREFFELTAEEKQKALNTLSEPEQRQIEKTLRTFGNLPPDQRDLCIRSFEKFAGLSLAERQQFLRSAERWELMSPAERQTWRELVHRLPPPLPPRPPPLPPRRPPLPPLPPRPTPPAPAVATNRN
jgi:hypothetical protein